MPDSIYSIWQRPPSRWHELIDQCNKEDHVAESFEKDINYFLKNKVHIDLIDFLSKLDSSFFKYRKNHYISQYNLLFNSYSKL